MNPLHGSRVRMIGLVLAGAGWASAMVGPSTQHAGPGTGLAPGRGGGGGGGIGGPGGQLGPAHDDCGLCGADFCEPNHGDVLAPDPGQFPPSTYRPGSDFSGLFGVPQVVIDGRGPSNAFGVGPYVLASVNGRGAGGSVFLGTGGAYVNIVDVLLPLNGIGWHHRRSYSTQSTAALGWHGEGWWSNEMTHLAVDGAEGASDVSVTFGPDTVFEFDYGAGTWTCSDQHPVKLSFVSGSDEYVMRRADVSVL